jgi:hypothetical protein
MEEEKPEQRNSAREAKWQVVIEGLHTTRDYSKGQKAQI